MAGHGLRATGYRKKKQATKSSKAKAKPVKAKAKAKPAKAKAKAKPAKAKRAPETPEGHGWHDLPVADAEAKAIQADRLKAEHHWLLATDFRPHSHHFHALAAARKSKHGAGTIEVGGAKVCLFFTSWGDGVFPIYLDVDSEERPVQVRVQLNTADSNADM